MTKIETDDGAVGKSLKTSAKKTDDSDECVCEIKAQMTVKRPDIDALAGLPAGFSSTFYTDDGAPIANMELKFPKRELLVDGKLWRGDNVETATLTLKNAKADNLRFRLEPLGAIMICRLSWRAAGDEVEEVSDLLGKWCSVNLTFVDRNAKQANLALEGGGGTPTEGRKKRKSEVQLEIVDGGQPAADGAGERPPLEPHEELPPGVPPIRRLREAADEPAADDEQSPAPAGDASASAAPRSLAERLAALGIDIPENERFWYQVSPAELQKVLKFVERSEAGGRPVMPSILKPYKRKVN